jgi:hypothetical protein
MKKLFIATLVVMSTFAFANKEVEKKNEKVINNIDGTCTVTVTDTDNNGTVVSGTGTASTCSKARDIAYNDVLSKI